MSKMRFSKRKLHFLFLSFLCWRNRNRKKKEKENGKGKKHPIKIGFLKVVMQKCEKFQKVDFLQKLPDTICVRKGEKTRIFVHTICFGQKFFFGPKTVQTRNNYKNSGFSGNCLKQKMTPFFGKMCFLTWVKKWGLLTVFFKSCVLLKTLFFLVFSETHSFSETKYVC